MAAVTRGTDEKRNKRKLSKILSWIFNIIFVLMILLFVVVFLTSRNNNGLKLGSYSVYTVLTGSMTPVFGPGDLIIVKSVPEDTLEVGDIITYHPVEGSETLVTHRIINIDNEDGANLYYTKGDANNLEDASPAEYRNIEGIVVNWITGFGSFVVFLRSPKGIIAIVAVFVAFHMITSVIPKILKSEE